MKAMILHKYKSKYRSLAPKIISFAILLIGWQLISMANITNTTFLPSPVHLVETVQDMLSTGELWVHSYSSVKRVFVGFFIASLIGITFGLSLGALDRVAAFFTPLIELLRPIPPIAWIPLAILWFGIGDRSSFFIVATGAFFPIFVNVFKGIHSVHPSYILAAKCLGANNFLMLTDIRIPSALPFIMTGLRIGVGISWTSVIAAELVGAQSGLGYMIQLNRIMLQTDKIIVGMITIGIIGFVMNQGMLWLEKKTLAWQEES